jgi:hypothetical protein
MSVALSCRAFLRNRRYSIRSRPLVLILSSCTILHWVDDFARKDICSFR